MNTDSSISTETVGPAMIGGVDDPALRKRLSRVSESNPIREIIDVAMVGLVGGGPRLAVRAARAFLQDSYASRASVREARSRTMSRRG
jgi:hypothetical protein